MNTELKKRIEEAAIKLQREVTPHKDWGDINYGFVKGAEFGYKEAIAQAKEWLKYNAQPKYIYIEDGHPWIDNARLLSDFEDDMNKL